MARIHFLTPFAIDKNIGKEYNDAVSRIPVDDWVCLRDGDTIFLTPDNQWGRQVHDVVKRHGHEYDLIACRTNRLRAPNQLHDGLFSDNHDIQYHAAIARERYANKYVNVSPYDGVVAGMFMLFPRRLWDQVKFRENSVAFDTHFTVDVRSAGGKTGIAEGIYIYHWYRAWAKDPLAYDKHLWK